MTYKTLPDILAKDLDIIFIGYNPGLRSAEVGHYFAGISNRFWYLLFHSGLVNEKLTYEDDKDLLKYRYGLTDIVKRPSKSAAEISKEEFTGGKERLYQLLNEYKPRVAAYLGIGIYQVFAKKKAVKLGLQAETVIPGVIDFVLPSPSGLNRMALKDKLYYFKLLREFLFQEKTLLSLEAAYPDAGPELIFNNPFQCLIATILSAQSTDKQVNKLTKKLFELCSTPLDFINISLEELEELIKGCGLYKTKAKNIKKTCQILYNEFNSVVPEDFDILTKLPGVGRKTANVVISCAFNQPGLAVDTHVFRVANRLGLANSDNVLQTELQLKYRIPEEKWSQAHHWLIFHGRRICHARNPKCNECTLAQYCQEKRGHTFHI